jgi:hypothetical protein
MTNLVVVGKKKPPEGGSLLYIIGRLTYSSLTGAI